MVPTPSICYETSEQEEYEEQHRVIQPVQVQMSQVIPEVEEMVDEDDTGSDVYYDDTKANALGHRRTVDETVAL